MDALNKSLLAVAIAAGALLWFLSQLKSVLAPFVIAFIISYFLAPLVSFLGKYRIPRYMGTIAVIGLFIIVLAIISSSVFPVLYKQASILANRLYDHKDEINAVLSKAIGEAGNISPEIKEKVEGTLVGLSAGVMDFFRAILVKLVNSSLVAFNLISIFFITPIVLFYTLRDWDVIVAALKRLLPVRLRSTSQHLLRDINHTLSGYVRGQALVCTIMGSYYAITLTVSGIESGLALGIISGMLTFMPYVGCLLGTFLCILVSVIQFASINHALIILAIFSVGQFFEGNFLTPRLIGKNVNLHPVWIMFGLMSGGALMGFTGMLIALPLTAVLGVAIRFALARYQSSKFYKSKK